MCMYICTHVCTRRICVHAMLCYASFIHIVRIIIIMPSSAALCVYHCCFTFDHSSLLFVIHLIGSHHNKCTIIIGGFVIIVVFSSSSSSLIHPVKLIDGAPNQRQAPSNDTTVGRSYPYNRPSELEETLGLTWVQARQAAFHAKRK